MEPGADSANAGARGASGEQARVPLLAPPDAATAPIKDVEVRPPAAPAAAPPPATRTGSPASGGGGPPQLGAYEIFEELGQGGFGRVYRARHAELGTECAVKVLIAGEHARPESIQRFRREAELVARMGKHPNIVTIHDLGEEGARTYYAMELVQGKSLTDTIRDRAARGSGLTPEEAAALVEKVARALHFAHEHRVIHRDLKPDNVVLNAAGEPQVLDFGLAQDQAATAAVAAGAGAGADRRTVAGTPIGTYAYMAPEQALGDLAALDARTDVYGIGGILYELLTGIPPHPGHWPQNAEQILRGDVLPPRRVQAGIPRDLETVCLKCLAPERELRYASAAAVADDLARWRRGEPVLAGRPSVTYRAWRWALRRWRVVVPAAAALVLVSGLSVWGWRSRRAGEEAAARAKESARQADEQRSKAEEQRRRMLANVRVAALKFEDSIMRVPMPAEVKPLLAEQPLGLIEDLVKMDPSFGPAYSWRGEVKRLLGRVAEAEADFDEGCRLSPGHAVVWYLRGMHRIGRYARARCLPVVATGTAGVGFESPRGETPREKALRQGGLADLAQMMEAEQKDTEIGAEEARLGRTSVALCAGQYESALKELEGMDSPRARRLRGTVLYYLQRFHEAVVTFEELLVDWCCDVEGWNFSGNARHALGVLRHTRGVDPQESYRKALDDYGAALAHNPEVAPVFNNRGVVYQSLGEAEAARGEDPRSSYYKAIEDYGEALARNPEYSLARINRGNAYLTLGEAVAARGADPRESYRKAISDYAAGLERSPESAPAYNNCGLAHLRLGEAAAARGADPCESYRRAVEACSSALGLKPRYAEAYNHRGNTYRSLGEAEAARGADPRVSYRMAIDDYGAALACSPEFAEAYNNRGNTYRSLGEAEAARGADPRENYRKAIEDYGAALARNPQYAVAYANRGVAYTSLGKAEAARGGDPRGSYNMAIQNFGEALARNSALALAHYNRGNAYLGLGEAEAARGADPRESYRKAVESFGEALTRNPEFAESYYNRGNAYRNLGEAEGARGADPLESYHKALEDYGGALARNPEHAEAYNNRGIVYGSLGKAEAGRGQPPESYLRAEADYRAAIQHHHSTAYLNLGLLYRTMGRFDDAVAAFESGAKAVPGQADWARSAIAETRRLQQPAAAPAPAPEWAREFSTGESAVQTGDYPSARIHYEAGLAALDHTLGGLPAADRAARLADAALRAALMNAHYNLACILALAATGRDRADAPAPAQAPAAAEAACLRDNAFDHLRRAIEFGYADAAHLAADSDLATLHDDTRWAELLRFPGRPPEK